MIWRVVHCFGCRGASAAVFVVTLVATTYGFGTLLRRAVRHAIYDLRKGERLRGRALPTILFVTLFLFRPGDVL